MEPSLKLRTNNNADRAGLSPQLDPLKDAIKSKTRNSSPCLSKTSWTALLLKETKDVTEVS
jgi:hypothetical protein